MDSLLSMAESKIITTASGDTISLNNMARSLGIFKGYDSRMAAIVNMSITDKWAQDYRKNNKFLDRLGHAWLVLTGKAVAFELS